MIVSRARLKRTVDFMLRRNLIGFPLVLFLSLVLVTPSNAVSFPDREVQSLTEAPWAAMIRVVNDGKGLSCTGILVDPMYVLTAAHCVYPAQTLEKMYVNFPHSKDSRVLTGFAAKHHPRYTPKGGTLNDIGVIRLSSPVTLFKPVTLTAKNDSSYLKKEMRLYGYGVDQNLDADDNLKSLKVTNISSELKSYRWFNGSTMVGVGRFFSKEKIWGGACYGDSGGPLVGFSGKTPVLVGIASFVITDGPYCNTSYPSVYTRVSVYLGWLKSTIVEMNRVYDRPGTPESLVISAQPSGVAVTWVAPVAQGRDPIEYYRLYIYAGNSLEPQETKLANTGTMVSGLEAGFIYRFSVAACTSKTCSEPTPEKIFQAG